MVPQDSIMIMIHQEGRMSLRMTLLGTSSSAYGKTVHAVNETVSSLRVSARHTENSVGEIVLVSSESQRLGHSGHVRIGNIGAIQEGENVEQRQHGD